MPNPWFRFKQFTIRQDQCAMKVSTDACIQGAWAAVQLKALPALTAPRVLDIGTGTGLLSLMLMQERPDALLDAIELHPGAAAQAADNFTQSPWAGRMRVYSLAMADFAPDQTYDFIICNPPFFHNHLQAPEPTRNDARHSVALDKETLALSLAVLLKADGKCCVLYPGSEWRYWLEEAGKQGLYPEQILTIQPNAGAAINRMVGIFSKEKPVPCIPEKLVIYEGDKSYTAAFTTLLRPYYLRL